jgi:hypothetical protein
VSEAAKRRLAELDDAALDNEPVRADDDDSRE